MVPHRTYFATNSKLFKDFVTTEDILKRFVKALWNFLEGFEAVSDAIVTTSWKSGLTLSLAMIFIEYFINVDSNYASHIQYTLL